MPSAVAAGFEQEPGALFSLIGVGETWKLVSRGGGLESAISACVVFAVAAYLIWSAIGTRQRLAQAMEEADAQAWDDAVQLRAEAILRAEEMKKQQAADS